MGFISSGCSLMIDPLANTIPPVTETKPANVSQLHTELAYVPEPIRKPVIAVYPESFLDHTGARRSNSKFATFSSAITQAPHAYLVRALKHAGSKNNGFFIVPERIDLQSVTKERQLIRQTRTEFNDEEVLPALIFADAIMTGGIISWQSNTTSSGSGVRHLGFGFAKEIREDIVTVSLRTVSVATGRVLIEVTTTKRIQSARLSNDVFKYISEGTELIELEGGSVANEPTSVALQMAIELSVLATIKEGVSDKLWRLKE